MWERRVQHGGERPMQAAERWVNERLDHLGIVVGVCQEMGVATW